MRFIATILGLGLIWFVASILGAHTWSWVTPVFGGLATLLFCRHSLRRIPSDPPHQGILVFLGRRMKKFLEEGLIWLPLRPVVFDALKVKVVKVNQDLPDLILRTPDKAEVSVSVSVTWTPGRKSEGATNEEKAEALIEYLNSGEEPGVREIIEDIIKDRLRVWAFSIEEGPADWREAVGARDDTIAILVKAILGEDLSLISSDIPTSVLLKYFANPQINPSKYEKGKYGKESENGSEWEKLEKEIKELSADNLNELKKQVEERRTIIQKLRQGNGYFYKKSLGITLNRFTVNAVKPYGKTAEAVDTIVKETYERESDEIEVQNVLARIKELMEKLSITPEQALEIVQTERKKVIKTIQEGKLNISPETREMLQQLLPGLLGGLSRLTK